MPVRINPSVRPYVCIMRCGSITLKRAVCCHAAHPHRNALYASYPVVSGYASCVTADNVVLAVALRVRHCLPLPVGGPHSLAEPPRYPFGAAPQPDLDLNLLTSGLLLDGHPEEVVLVGFCIAVKGFELDLDRPLGHPVDDLKGGDEGLVAEFLVSVDLSRTYIFAIDPDRHADRLFTGVTKPGPCSRDDERPAAALVVGALFGQRAVIFDNLFGAKEALLLGLLRSRAGLADGIHRGYHQHYRDHKHRQSDERRRLRCQHPPEWVDFHIFLLLFLCRSGSGRARKPS